MIYDVEFNSAGQVPSSGILAAGKIADERGFGTLWKGESNSRDPAALLPAVAAMTKKIRIGPAVMHIHARTAVETAIYSATLDELSQGRFVLGLGCANVNLAGWHGLQGDHPLTRVEEYITIFRKVIAREKLNVQGKYYSSKNFRLEFEPYRARVPIILASLGPKMAKLAGRMCEGVMMNMADPGRIKFVASNMAEGAKEAGRDPADLEVVAKVRVSVNEDIEKAKNALKKVVTFYSLAPHYRDMLAQMGLPKEVERIQETYRASGFKAAAKTVTDEMLGKIPIVPATSMKELRQGVKKYDTSGVTSIVIAYVPSTEQSAEETIQFVKSW
jgi:alkanesulfonate monooxygenase SsuD/methylene tetrahydromethanopterin reductase-like flavin-dependent oxidoreductase (luciferase family)